MTTPIPKQVIDLIETTAVQATKLRYMEQGHNLTGKGAASIRAETTSTGNTTTVSIYAADYVYTLNRGVPASRIPYTPNSGATTSKFIDGLKNYAKLRFGLGDKEALSVAFQIARKQKAQGMPTIASQRFSKTGKRTGFVNEAILDVNKTLRNSIGKMLFQNISRKLIAGR
jgi:hypothetical protein